MILSALMTIFMLGMVAFCVDLGYVLSVREEMQRNTDAAAMAACWDFGQRLADGEDVYDAALGARDATASCVGLNAVANLSPSVDLNTSNAAQGDIVFGRIADVTSGDAQFETSDPNVYNAVRVRLRKSDQINGQAPFYFARIFGLVGQDLTTDATAVIVRNISGWRTPSGGGNLQILPFALDEVTWNAMLAGNAPDVYRWDAVNGVVSAGSDGKLEMNLFPQGTGSPGNRGTVDIGSSNNSTSDIARQIVYGISAADMASHDGVLEFDHSGKLYLDGDTGISAGVKDELASIIGQTRVIPIFREVNGPGNNAIYTIVKWGGVRICDVKLTGPMNKKHLTIQPAPVASTGIIPSTVSGQSDYVYSPAVLYN